MTLQKPLLSRQIRVSTKTQKFDLQIVALLKKMVNTKNIYSDIAFGAKSKRKDREELHTKLRKCDTIVFWKMNRTVSLSHLVKILKEFGKKGVHFKSLQEAFIDCTSAHGRFVFSHFGAVAQLERDVIIEKTRAGLESSKRRVVRLGRKPGLDTKGNAGRSWPSITIEITIFRQRRS